VANGGTNITNTAQVNYAKDPDATDNEDSVTTFVRGRADLSISKTADKAIALLGETLTYTIVVKNDGPNTATGVRVRDDIPNQADLQSVSSNCVKADPVECDLGDIASGASATATITVKPKEKGHITNTAAVTSSTDEDDPDSADRTASVTTDYVALKFGDIPSGAFGESIDVKTILGVQVKSGPLASVTLPAGGGGPITDSAVKVNVTGGYLLKDLVKLEALKASTQGGKTAGGQVYVASSADVAKASLVNNLIAVEGLHSECYATSAQTGSQSSANIAKLRIAGVLVSVAAGPNSTVTVPGVGQLILNEQIQTGSGLNQRRAVNALHLQLDGLLAKGDIILAHSDCGIDP
jgi:uncharacterized repeat protein (TIGR01451 family)